MALKKNISVQLPEAYNVPEKDISKYTLMFFGEKKCGKTSLAAQFPDHFILEFEPGNAAHLNCRFADVHNWEETLAYIALLKENKDYCKTLVIDDIPSVYEYCMNQVRKDLGKAETDKPGFDGYDVCKRRFNQLIKDIQTLPFGKIYTAHDKIRDCELRGGGTISQLETSMSGQCKEIIDKYITLTGYIKKDNKNERIMQIEGDKFIKANNGFKNHFLKPDETKITDIPLGTSPEMGYSNLIKAYHNELYKIKVKPKVRINKENMEANTNAKRHTLSEL